MLSASAARSTCFLDMIAINRETDYACRVILHLAMHPPGYRTTAREIADLQLIPQSLIRRVVRQLSSAQLLRTTRGTGGGIVLARDPSEISLLDVVEAIEGPLVLNECTVNPRFCPLMRTCSIHEAWVRAKEVLIQQLRNTTFDKLADRGKFLSEGDPSRVAV